MPANNVQIDDEKTREVLARLGRGESVPFNDAAEAWRALRDATWSKLPKSLVPWWDPLNPSEAREKA